MIKVGLACLLYALPIYANDEFAPSWRGSANTVKVVFDFTDPNDINAADVDITSPDFPFVTASVLEGQEFGTEACESTGGRKGVVAGELIRALVTNLAVEGESTTVRVQVTSTLSALPFTGIESATGVFDDGESFVGCDLAEGIESEPVDVPADLGNGYFTVAVEAVLTSPFGCDDIQFFMEEPGENVCIDQVIIDIQHNTNPGQVIVANASPSTIDVIEGGTPTNMVISLDPNLGPVTGPIFVTLDPLSGLDIELDTVAAPRVLTFTNGNWETPQTVSVAGSNDTNFETCIEPFPFQAQVSAAFDSAFDGGAAQVPLAINVMDLDSGCVFVEAVDTELEESIAGPTGSLVYTLNRSPSSPVFVDITDGFTDPNNPFFTSDPNQLTFDSGNWNTAQTVALSAVQDEEFRGTPGTGEPTGTTAVTTISGDGTYTEIPAAIAITVTEDECGALEFNSHDFNNDCTVDILDLSEFIQDWLNCSQAGC